jgi:hypothetical protein
VQPWKSLAAYRAALDQLRSKKLNEEEVADLIEKDVLPGWEAEQRKLAALKGLPPPLQGVVAALLPYMEAREQGWSLLVRGLRAHDMTAVRAAGVKQLEAERLAKLIGKQGATRKP